MKPRIPIEVVVAILAGISCLVTLSPLVLPVWTLFIGWAWYFSMGATPACFKQIIPAVFPGALLAALCLAAIGWMGGGFGAMVIAVTITVFLLMLSLKIPMFSASLPAFNSYSSVFALFAIGGFPELAIGPVLSCTLWTIIAALLGPVFGWLSIVGQFPKKAE